MKYLKLVFKILLVGGIFYWLIQTKKVDFNLVHDAFTNGYGWLICFCALLSQNVLVALRWKTLLDIKSKPNVSFLDALKINWIGHFFSSILPGIFLGDILKLNYFLKKNYVISKKYLIFSILLDRVMGLIGLLILNGLIMLATFQQIYDIDHRFRIITFFSFCFAIGGIVLFSSMIYRTTLHNYFLNIFKNSKWKIFQKISIFIEHLYQLSSHKKPLFKALFCSMAIQMFSIIGFISLTRQFIHHDVNLLHMATMIPLGNVIIALPIIPLGIGVGHVAYQNLFSIIGIDNGASLFNIYLILSFGMNLLGLIPFILHKQELKLER